MVYSPWIFTTEWQEKWIWFQSWWFLRALHEYNLLQKEPIYPSIDCVNGVSKIGSPFKSKAFIYLKIFVKVKLLLSHLWLFATPWIIARQAPQSMELSRQEYWSGLSFLSPGDLPNLGTEPSSPALQADSLQSELYFHNSLKYLEN